MNKLKDFESYGFNRFYNFKGQELYHTSFGLIMTVFTYLIMLPAIYYYLVLLISKRNPNVNTSVIDHNLNDTTDYFNTNNSKILPFALKVIYNNNGTMVLDNLYAYVLGINTSSISQEIIYQVLLEDCHPDNFTDGEYKNSPVFKKTGINQADLLPDKTQKTLCVPSQDLNLEHFINSNEITYYLIVDYFETVTDNPLSNLQVEFFALNYVVNSLVYESPFIPSLKSIRNFQMLLNQTKTAELVLTKTKVDTDIGWVTTEIFDQKEIGCSDIKNEFLDTAISPMNSYSLKISITPDSTIIYYKRSYVKVQDFFASIGGIFNILKSGFNAVLILVMRFLYNLDLINTLFEFDQDYLEKFEKQKISDIRDSRKIKIKTSKIKQNKTTDNQIQIDMNGKKEEERKTAAITKDVYLTSSDGLKIELQDIKLEKLEKVEENPPSPEPMKNNLSPKKTNTDINNDQEVPFQFSGWEIFVSVFLPFCIREGSGLAKKKYIYQNLKQNFCDLYLDIQEVLLYHIKIRKLLQKTFLPTHLKLKFKQGEYLEWDYIKEEEDTI
jgi:hypothetical protein